MAAATALSFRALAHLLTELLQQSARTTLDMCDDVTHGGGSGDGVKDGDGGDDVGVGSGALVVLGDGDGDGKHD